MRIEEVLAEVDELKPNTYDDNIKIKWLSELDGKIFNDVISTHEGEVTEFIPYTEADLGKELLAEFPYTEMYRHYIFANIDYSNGETDRYTNSMLMFNNSYSEFTKWYNRTHLPLHNKTIIY